MPRAAGPCARLPASGIAYSVLITVASILVWRRLAGQAGTSDVLSSESTAWRIGALRGVGMIVGFTILLAITGSAQQQVEQLRAAITAGTEHLPYDIWLDLDIRPATVVR